MLPFKLIFAKFGPDLAKLLIWSGFVASEGNKFPLQEINKVHGNQTSVLIITI